MSTSGSFWTFLTTARAWLAASSDFRAWCGATDAADALNYIHLFAATPNTAQLKYAVIAYTHGLQADRDTTGQGEAAFTIDRAIRLAFFEWLAVGTPHSAAASEAFGNNLGLFYAYALDNSWGSLHLRRIAHEFDARAPIPGDWHIEDGTAEGRMGYHAALVIEEDR